MQNVFNRNHLHTTKIRRAAFFRQGLQDTSCRTITDLFPTGAVVIGFVEPKIAIVGSRKATPKGQEFAHQLASHLATLGIAIVSGFAYGIDINAHKGAMQNGATIAVLGSGLNRIYPKGT